MTWQPRTPVDDRQLWIEVRGGLLGLLAAEEDLDKRRALGNIVAAIERRWNVEKQQHQTVVMQGRPADSRGVRRRPE